MDKELIKRLGFDPGRLPEPVVSLEHLYPINPVQSMEMAVVESEDIPKKLPKSLIDRIFDYEHVNPQVIDVIFNDGEFVKTSEYCAFQSGVNGRFSFTFGFVRAGATAKHKALGFNNPDPKFNFCSLLVIVGPKNKPTNFYIGDDFEDKEFEPIWWKLGSLEDHSTAATLLSKEHYGPLLSKHLRPIPAAILMTDRLNKLIRGKL